ncbi:MAG: DEAD/DEAH box helicase, partial [Lacunisphaera sp.]
MRSVKTPEALRALRTWIDSLDATTREQGETLYANLQVEDVWADADHYVEAKVTDDEPYAVKLFLTRSKWDSRCTCDVRVNCKHGCAAGLAWLADIDVPINVDDNAPIAPATTAKSARTAQKKTSFRNQWTPTLVEKLGRSLTESEGRQLANLAALFAEFTQSHHTLYPGAINRHGFEHTLPPGVPDYAPAFTDWWEHGHPPADPWALWQFIAYDYELAGREIPEVFRPLTNTKSVHAAIHDRLVQKELAVWHKALDPVVSLAPGPTADITGIRARITPAGGLVIEVRAADDKPWKIPAHKWFKALRGARPADFEHLPAAEAALGSALTAECLGGMYDLFSQPPLPADAARNILRTMAARGAVVLPNGKPFAVEAEPLVPEATLSPTVRDQLDLRLVAPDGRTVTKAPVISQHPETLYLFDGRVWRGPPLAPSTQLPTSALGDARIMSRLRAAGLRLPSALEVRVRRVPLRPVLKCWLSETTSEYEAVHFHAQLTASAEQPRCEQQWTGHGWQWTKNLTPPPRDDDDPLIEFDLGVAENASTRFAQFRLVWQNDSGEWTRYISKNFPDEFLSWHASLPPGLTIDASLELAGLLGPPLRASVEISAAPVDGAGHRDWFDLTVALRVEDTTFSADELALLLKARGKWVRLAKHGWRRLELDHSAEGNPGAAALARLGLHAEDVIAGGRPTTHRLHAIQLAAKAESFAARDSALVRRLRERAAAIIAMPPADLPTTLRATLRPYQLEGFQFLSHLSNHSFGGVLADDMGLGKTVQALAWLLHLADVASQQTKENGRTTPFRALIVCPKSVMHGWLTETERFAPTLTALAFAPTQAYARRMPGPPDQPALLVVNYTQLRLQPDWFKSHDWDAVVLDEAQFIKNPSSQTAVIARSLGTSHRLALTGTPIENRLLDLWSLFAFAQPGLLGAQASFKRQYPVEDQTSTSRLHQRVRHFLLRRTKAQVAPELPPRTEDEIVVDLEGPQRVLYDAELKRARAQLLGIETNKALDGVRFNVLASLLRLRQISCHGALISDAHASMPSAKLDALLERVEELRDEGQQVLVFSQFVSLLELIRPRLAAAGVPYLMLTGQTENRAELVDKFQSDKTQTVFLLSLKAAGFGLNLTAASYVILCDPWWNPAVEAQAIDRTHRIGQTQPVVAYRLVAADTVEQKILAMQREKSALANAVVQEDSLANVLDLDSLRQILS